MPFYWPIAETLRKSTARQVYSRSQDTIRGLSYKMNLQGISVFVSTDCVFIGRYHEVVAMPSCSFVWVYNVLICVLSSAGFPR